MADTVETLVNVLEMSYDEQYEAQFLQVWKEKCILMNRDFEEKLFNEISQKMMEVCYKKIFGRFVKKVVQYRRQRIQHERDLDIAFDYAIEIPHRAQLDAWKSVAYAESAVNYLLECQGEAIANEEFDEVATT